MDVRFFLRNVTNNKANIKHLLNALVPHSISIRSTKFQKNPRKTHFSNGSDFFWLSLASLFYAAFHQEPSCETYPCTWSEREHMISGHVHMLSARRRISARRRFLRNTNPFQFIGFSRCVCAVIKASFQNSSK